MLHEQGCDCLLDTVRYTLLLWTVVQRNKNLA